MAVTFNDIVERVKQQLLGYAVDQEVITFLADSMTATDTMFTCDPETTSSAMSRGMIEIDDELIWVKKFDKVSGTVEVMGGLNGRGYANTTAAAHAADTFVKVDPAFPRKRIKEAINDAIRGVYPDLWVFGEYEFPYVAARYEYPIPAEAEDVYKVVINTIGPSRVWFPATKWRYNALASVGSQVAPTPAPTGRSIQIYDFVVPGRNVRVTYRKKPNDLVNNNDDFETVTGFPERYVDMIVYSAIWRLLPALEAARLQQSAVESTERSKIVGPKDASNASTYYMQLYQTRLREERERLLELYDSNFTFNG